MAKSQADNGSKRVGLAGSQRELLPNSVPIGPADLSEVVAISVRVRSRGDMAELAKDAERIGKTAIGERQYLTRDQLASRYGANPADINALEQFAQRHNLRVAARDDASRTLVLKGKLGDVLNAFHADVQMYQHSSGTYRGRRGEIMIPVELKDVITGLFGFDTRPKYRSPTRMLRSRTAAAAAQKGEPATVFAQRYHFPTQSGSIKLDGTGQCIAIIELGGGFRHSDLKTYFHDLGIPLPVVTAISVDHGVNHPTARGEDDGEVMLDIEVAGAVTPAAKLAVYFAPNTDSGFLDAINTAVHDSARQPSVVSISWGEPDDFLPKQNRDAYHQVFMSATVLGVTILAASGDHGVADMDAGHWDGKIHVNHPASDDLVLCCGGTQIDPKQGDVVWNDGTKFDVNVFGGGGWAGGGGISTVFDVPSYQASLQMPNSLVTHKQGRGCPDIAMTADNYRVRIHGQNTVSGGTSAVTPLMASLLALINQALGKNVGFVNPLLYANPGAFDDVITGTNGIKNDVEGYPASRGWDACTGLGTPNGTKLLSALTAKP